ncbi:hypothetical protein FRB99_004563 [Tulasnella sp. 403]|nr:hypothetical protein FRB99_004563 [Tulasnella sp. 403]
MQSRRHGFSKHLRSTLAVLLLLTATVLAQPASLPFTDCSAPLANPDDASRRINISAVYAQIADYGEGKRIKYVAIGETGDVLHGATPTLLATLFKTSSVLSFNLDETKTAVCGSFRAPTSEVPVPDNTNCTIPPGPVAFSAETPFRHDFSLTTISTRLRALDALSPPFELACIEVNATPIVAEGKGGYYGKAQVIFWASVGLTAAYWIVIGIARIAAAWDRGGSGRREGWMRVKWAGTVLSSAISGDRLSASPALLRFDPILRNTAWATLIYNVTLIQGSNSQEEHWDVTDTRNYSPPPAFADQISNRSSPLFLDSAVKNQLLLFPEGTKPGMRSFAYSVGIRPQDLFGTCLTIYLSIVAATIIISLVIWFLDWFISSTVNGGEYGFQKAAGRSPKYSAPSDIGSKNGAESPHVPSVGLPASRFAFQSRRAWWNYRLGQSSFHQNILYGNLVRILLLFHIPITLFSCYQFSLGRPDATVPSLALAGLAFTFLSLLLPGFLLSRLAVTSTGKLYEATRTLLSLGPLYYHYSPGQQSFAFLVFAHNLAFSVVVGAGQQSGTAQAIILLIVEVLAALATSMWLPWGEGAHMGALSFMFCVGRIITCVLLVIMCPVVNVGAAAAGWIAYSILIINGLIYFMFTLMIITKIAEGLVRLFGGLPFDKSRSHADSGLSGAINQLPCCGGHRRKNRRHQYRPSHVGRDASRTSGSSKQKMLHPTHPPSLNASTGGGSTTPVQSYLRPEQAATPYREDGDDPESGYILGAFHDDYMQPETQRQPPPQATNTGFTRIKGGKAHFDNPFAIHDAPNPDDRKPQYRRPVNAPSTSGYEPPPSSYTPVNVVQNAEASTSGISAHNRKRSETAIVEDVSMYMGGHQREPSASRTPPATAGYYRSDGPLPPPPVVPMAVDDGSTDSSPKPKRKFWFGSSNSRAASDPMGEDSDGGQDSEREEGKSSGRWPFRRARNKSDADALAPPPSTSPPPTGGRSFQVVRPQRSGLEAGGAAAAGGRPAPSSWRRPSTAPAQGDEDVGSDLSLQSQSSRQASWSRRQSAPFG